MAPFINILQVVAAIGIFFLGFIVFLTNRRERVNQFFFLFVIAGAAWILSVFMFQITGNIFWGRMIYAAASFIPLSFCIFTKIFPRMEEKTNIAIDIFFAVMAGLLFLLSWSGLFITGVVQRAWGPDIVWGNLSLLYNGYFILYMGYGFYILADKYRKAYGVHRVQIQYVFLGVFLTTTMASSTNIILPLFGIARFYPLGPAFSFFTFAFVAYTILRHRLLDVKLIIERGLVYSLVTTLIATVYVLLILFSEHILRQLIGYTSIIVIAVAAFLIAIAFKPLVDRFREIADKIFFKGKYDYKKTIREVSEAVTSIIQLGQLSELITVNLVESMKLQKAALLALDRKAGIFKAISARGYLGEKKTDIKANHPLPRLLLENKQPIVCEEIESVEENGNNQIKTKQDLLAGAKEEMGRLGVALSVPLVFKDELVGILNLGEKLSRDPFTDDDIATLQILANETAIAIENARLYEEVLATKNYSEDVLQSMTEGVVTVSMEARIITINQKAEKILGLTLKKVVGKPVREVFARNRVLWEVIEDSLLRNKEHYGFEAIYVREMEGNAPIRINTTLLADSSHKRIGVLMVISDLSEVKELEEHVRRADKLAALGTMAAGMAHEIKNPLSSMKVLSQLMAAKFEEPEFRKKFAEIMPREIDKIDRIVEGLLGFARSAAPRFERVNLKDVLEEVLILIAPQLERAGVELVRLIEEVPSLTADRQQLTQIIMNLCLNAIQAMPEGGKLTISVSMVEKKLREDSVVIGISDTGFGIPKEHVQHLFDPFFTTKHGGTGLGLTIVYRIVESHNGKIQVQSKPRQGTTFTITLPLLQ